MLSDRNVSEPYTVAWIDCLARGRNLGRSVFMTGEHTEAKRAGGALLLEPGLKVPFDLPRWLLNPVGLKAFNAFFYLLQARKSKPFLSGFDPFFYPLDKIGNWNRIYGSRGLIQYQCVLPEATSFEGMKRILEAISAAGAASFLAVLKRMGDPGEGMLSFPMPGFTLALDLPFRGQSTLQLAQRLDELVLHYGGRVNLCKDACLSPGSFRGMYPKFGDWLRVKAEVDPNWALNSTLARRLELDRGL
jgi:FAD/FMN-containing dehydrogenase